MDPSKRRRGRTLVEVLPVLLVYGTLLAFCGYQLRDGWSLYPALLLSALVMLPVGIAVWAIASER